MDRMKYIVFADGEFSNEFVIFPTGMKHKDVAGARSVKSAGFVRIEYDLVAEKVVAVCHGQSVSLHVSSDGADSRIITRYLQPML